MERYGKHDISPILGLDTRDATRSTNLMQSYSRMPRDPSAGPHKQGLEVNIS